MFEELKNKMNRWSGMLWIGKEGQAIYSVGNKNKLAKKRAYKNVYFLGYS